MLIGWLTGRYIGGITDINTHRGASPGCCMRLMTINDRMAGRVHHSAQPTLTIGDIPRVTRCLSDLSYLITAGSGVTTRRGSLTTFTLLGSREPFCASYPKLFSSLSPGPPPGTPAHTACTGHQYSHGQRVCTGCTQGV